MSWVGVRNTIVQLFVFIMVFRQADAELRNFQIVWVELGFEICY